jgi:MarR family transcriptional regulator, negative regulator of the multidrug operon emrRAB
VNRFVNNLVGAFSLVVSDALTKSTAGVVGHSGALAAALSYLQQEPGCSMDELREPLALSEPAVVRLVNSLVEAGLVIRSTDPRDGRRVRVRLSGRGRRIAANVLEARRRAIEGLLSTLSSKEQGDLGALISKALAAATENHAQGERTCRLCDVKACPESRCPIEASLNARAG